MSCQQHQWLLENTDFCRKNTELRNLDLFRDFQGKCTNLSKSPKTIYHGRPERFAMFQDLQISKVSNHSLLCALYFLHGKVILERKCNKCIHIWYLQINIWCINWLKISQRKSFSLKSLIESPMLTKFALKNRIAIIIGYFPFFQIWRGEGSYMLYIAYMSAQ